MCGRFTVKMTWAELVAMYWLTLSQPPHNLRPSFNVCPTDPVDVVTEQDGQRDFVRMRWGLVPRWWPKPLKELKASTFNARAETVETKPFFRDAFKRTRCLIPASGYYEWKNEAGGKQPYYFSRSDGYPLTFAGLWDEWKDRAADETLKSCTMIVTDPNDLAAEIHDRACRSFWSAPTSSHGCMMAGRGCSGRLQMRFFSAGQFPSASIARKPIPTTKL